MSLHSRFQQWLLPRQSEGSVGIVLNRQRIFILPSAGGFLYALALLVMLLGAINYNLALGHALVFLLASLGVSGMVHSFRNLLGICLRPGRCSPVFAGETAYFPLLLSQQKTHPRRALQFSSHANRDITVTCQLEAGTSYTVSVPVPATRRGWLNLPPLRLETRFPLGLFVAWSNLRPTMRCLIYPRPLHQPLPAESASSDGTTRLGHTGDEDFAGLRPRQAADSMRHVAWKNAARDDGRRPLQIKQFAGGNRQNLRLAWDLLPPDMLHETRISTLAGWVLAADAASLSYSLEIPGCTIPLASGQAQYQRCLKQLALCA